MADKALNDVRLNWFFNAGEHYTITQQDSSGRRLEIDPLQASVNYWINRGEVRWYVAVEGQVVRRDGERSRQRRRVTFWADHDEPEKIINRAPEWVQEIVATAHDLIGSRLLESQDRPTREPEL